MIQVSKRRQRVRHNDRVGKSKLKVNNQAVLITGCSSGIGYDCALYLADLGYYVFATARDIQALSSLSHRYPKTIIPLSLDITDQQSVSQTYHVVIEKLGNKILTGIVNNAGIAVPGPLEFLPIELIQLQLEVNVTGQIRLIQEFLPLLRQYKGRVVNIGSIAGKLSLPFGGAYAASKHALEAITDALRIELHESGIQVALIEPSATKSKIWEKSIHCVETNITPQSQKIYDKYYNKIIQSLKRSANQAIETQEVSKAIFHALNAKIPKTRYLVGKRAKLLRVVSLLPDKFRDWIILKNLTRS